MLRRACAPGGDDCPKPAVEIIRANEQSSRGLQLIAGRHWTPMVVVEERAGL